MRKEKIIIFDFDGVIADSFEIAFDINKIARPRLTREQYRKLFDGNIYDAKFDEPAEAEIDFFAEAEGQYKVLGIDEKIKLVIKKLNENYRLFIISSTTSPIISEYLERHGLLACFAEIFGWEIETSKIKKFEILFKKYEISPTDAMFISDTSGDIREAKEAKVNFIVGIIGGYQSRASLEKARPDVIAEDINDFYRIIQERQ